MLSMLMRIGADATGAQRVIAGVATGANKAFSAIGKELTNRLVGAFAAGAVIDRATAFVKETADYADNLGDLAENLGITIEEVQRLQVAANLAGVKFQKMQMFLEKITALQAQAVEGDEKALAIFAKLGVNPRALNALQIMELATNNQAVAMELFDRKAKSVSNTMEKLKSLGPINLISSEQSDEIGKANDQIDEAYRKAMAAATPAITAFLKGAAIGLEQISKPDQGIVTGGPMLEILKRNLISIFGGTAGGVDLSALPIDPNRKKEGKTQPQIPPLALAAQSDALGRIGLFVGGRANVGEQMVTIGNYQLTELRRMRSILEEANR